MDAEEAVMSQTSQRTRRPGSWKWGLGGVGALGIGLTACSLVCSVLVPLLLALGAGTGAISFVESGAGVAGELLVVGGIAAIAVGAVHWWRQRQRRSCGCADVPAGSPRSIDRVDPSPPKAREPIACSLDGQGVRRRLDEFRDVFERSYLDSERIEGGVRWRFRTAPGLESDLRSLADREQECCRFFRFDIRTVGNEMWWDSRVDDVEAQPILEEFFTLPSQLGKHEGVDRSNFWPGHTEQDGTE
jgi:hypothetical protein